MIPQQPDDRTRDDLLREVEELRRRLTEAEDTINAIREGEVDAIIVSGSRGEQIFSLTGTDHVYRIIVETMSEAALTVSFEGRVLFCNRQFSRLLGIPGEHILGSFFHDLVPAGARSEASLLLERSRTASVTRRFVFTGDGGREIPVHLSSTVIGTSEGESVCMVATDLSELESSSRLIQELNRRQEALSESEQRWATTLASIGDAVIATDPKARITFMNPIAETLTGWALQDAQGKPVSDVFRVLNEYTRFPVENPVEKVLSRGRIVGLANHTVLVRRDGTEIPIDDSGAPIRNGDGRIHGAVLVFREISERRRTEEELLRAKARAESANRAKSEFLANMSHDIRTPIAGILGMIDLLAPTLQGREEREYLSLMETSARSLMSLIGDILDLSRIESGKDALILDNFSPAKEIERLLDLFRFSVRDKGLSLVLDLDPGLPRAVRGDREKLGRVLRNLVSNAVKYSDRGEVRVKAFAKNEGHGRITLECSVSDTGIGIPADKTALLFQSFTRLAEGNSSSGPEGSGLGLAICRRLVEIMGGEIRAESEVGRGSVFSFRIPLETAAQIEEVRQETIPEYDPLSEIPPLRILLAEDNRINQIFIEKILTRAGHEVIVARNGREAVEYITGTSGGRGFDLVLMDVQMPVMDGTEATRAIRGLPGAPSRLPVIALTANALKEDEERFRAVGMNGYVVKPIDWGELAKAIRQVYDRTPM